MAAEDLDIAAVLHEQLLQLASACDGAVQNIGEADVIGSRCEQRDGAGERCIPAARLLQNIRPRFSEQLDRLPFIDHRETRRDSRFDRETCEQMLTKSVDGLDFQTTRGLQRLCEQAARNAQILAFVGACADFCQFCP